MKFGQHVALDKFCHLLKFGTCLTSGCPNNTTGPPKLSILIIIIIDLA